MSPFAIAIIVLCFTVAALCAVLLILSRQAPPGEPFDCGECGRTGTGPRCRIIDHDEDPVTGEGFAMVADFHPECCPVIDPTHEHAR